MSDHITIYHPETGAVIGIITHADGDIVAREVAARAVCAQTGINIDDAVAVLGVRSPNAVAVRLRPITPGRSLWQRIKEFFT